MGVDLGVVDDDGEEGLLARGVDLGLVDGNKGGLRGAEAVLLAEQDDRRLDRPALQLYVLDRLEVVLPVLEIQDDLSRCDRVDGRGRSVVEEVRESDGDDDFELFAAFD